jgi:hypothetical protein
MPKTSTKREEQVHRQRKELIKGFGSAGEILKCSLIERYTVCGRPGCRCMGGEKHGPYLYVSYFDGKQSRQVYVPQLMQAQVRGWVRNYQRLSGTVGKLSDLSVELIRLRQPKLMGKGLKSERRVKQ